MVQIIKRSVEVQKRYASAIEILKSKGEATAYDVAKEVGISQSHYRSIVRYFNDLEKQGKLKSRIDKNSKTTIARKIYSIIK